MVKFKKQIVVAVTLLLVLVATILPVGAQDNSATPPSPSNGSLVITIHIGGFDGGSIALTLPIRCGSSC